MNATIIEIFFFILLVIFTPPRKAESSNLLGFEQTNSIRGIAILMVVLMHTSCNLGIRAFTPFGGIGVALFLMLSGYGLSESFKKKGCKGYWSNKVRKIWVPYIVVLTIVKVWNSSFDTHTILQYLCIDSPFWYISFLFYNYVLFYLCHRCSRLYKFRFVLFIVWGCLLFFFDSRIRAEQCLCFVTGMWLSENKKNVYRYIGKKRETLALVSLLVFVSFTALLIKQIPACRYLIEHYRLLQNFSELLIKYPFAFALILAFSAYATLLKKRACSILVGNRFLTYCSTISLELYMVHFSLLQLLSKEHPIVSLYMFLILSFVLSTILYYSIKYIFRWKK